MVLKYKEEQYSPLVNQFQLVNVSSYMVRKIALPVFLERLLVKVTNMLYCFILTIFRFELGRTFPF